MTEKQRLKQGKRRIRTNLKILHGLFAKIRGDC